MTYDFLKVVFDGKCKTSGFRILGNRLFMTIECSQSEHSIVYRLFRRATDGARTRDLHLGKVAYYQLYYCRILSLADVSQRRNL